MKTYAQLLKDPRWQKKRLEILERDEFTCQNCHDSENTLHVHHCYYETGMMPWEYDSGSLVTLCECCHDNESDALFMKKELSKAFSLCGFKAAEFNALSNGVYESCNKGLINGWLAEVAADIISKTLSNDILMIRW